MADIIKENVSISNEEINEIQKKMDEAKEQREKEYRLYYPNDEKIQELSDKISQYQELLDAPHWVKFKPIKSTIDALKKEIGYLAETDEFEYTLRQDGDKSFLNFEFTHYCDEDLDDDYDCDEDLDGDYVYDTLYGYIIYDSKGNIYLSRYERGHGSTDVQTTGIHEENSCDFGINFIDDKYISITEVFEDASLFKLVDGKYELIHTFEGDSNIEIIPSLWEKKLIARDHNIYNADEDKFIFTSEKAFIQSYDRKYFSIPIKDGLLSKEAAEQLKNQMKDFMKQYNLLLIMDTIKVTNNDDQHHSIKRYYDTFCFMDLKGNIVSKLYVVSGDNLATYTYKVTSDTYDDTLDEIKKGLTNALLKELAAEKERKACELEKMRIVLFDQLNFMNDFENQDPNANKFTLEN